MEYELTNQWLIDWDNVSELDYRLWSSNPLDIPVNKNTNNYFYNQGKKERTYNACVLYANAASLWYTMDYEFSEKELLEIVELAEKEYWWKEDYWMYISKWVDCVRNYWNKKFPDNKVKTFRMTIGDEDFAKALKNNYRIVVWYRTCREYYKDSQDDWIVQWEEFSNFHWWHCVSSLFWVAEIIAKDEWILIQDNYTWSKKFNIYYNNKIAKLKNSWTFFPSAFIYLKEKTMADTIKDNIDLDAAKEMFDKWYWNWLNPREPMSRQEVMTVLKRILDSNK